MTTYDLTQLQAALTAELLKIKQQLDNQEVRLQTLEKGHMHEDMIGLEIRMDEIEHMEEAVEIIKERLSKIESQLVIEPARYHNWRRGNI